jgi:hypothetical protein
MNRISRNITQKHYKYTIIELLIIAMQSYCSLEPCYYVLLNGKFVQPKSEKHENTRNGNSQPILF